MKKKLLALLILISFSINFAKAAEFDATFIKMEIPSTVKTSETFLAKIYMKNTGTSAWGNISNTRVTLISQNTVHNKIWGTDFIILGQGRIINPGDTVAFISYLQAPINVGTYPFSWQLQFPGAIDFYGETASSTIQVVLGDMSKYPDPVFNPKVITMDDFEYIGSFGIPTTSGDENVWTESGLSLRRKDDGTKTLFANSGTYTYKLFEMEIPELVNLNTSSAANLNTATMTKIWGSIGKPAWGTPASGSMYSNSGFYWDNAKKTLYWTYYNGYYTQNPFPVIGATKLDDNGDTTYLGHWFLPPVKKWKSYWGGVTSIPEKFANDYLDGRKFAIGFGGYYSIAATASMGPAIAAFAEPSLSKDTLDLKEILCYADKPAPRDGNYFNANIGYWNTDAINIYKGFWTADDHVRAGVFIQTPSKEGYISFSSLGTGRIGYDYGSVTRAGKEDAWYIYNLDDLGAAAKGIVNTNDILPYEFKSIDYPGDGWDWYGVTGACFDEVDKILYLYKTWGVDKYPVIHAYKIKDITTEVSAEQNEFFSVSPNPLSSSVKITLKNAKVKMEEVSVRIIDMKGILRQSFNVTYANIEAGYFADVSTLPQGIYLIIINNPDQTFQKTITVIKE